MKVLQINIFGNLSTGRIATDLYRSLVDSGYDGKVLLLILIYSVFFNCCLSNA